MDTAGAPSQIGKRSVSKVRRPFLNKRTDENEPETAIDSATKYITNNDVWLIATSIVNSKKDKKISTSIKFLNSHFNVKSITTGNHPRSKVVTLNLKVNQKNVSMPWEYMTKKLEAYDDIELLSMIKEFAKLHVGFTKAISTNFGLLPSDNPQSEVEMRKIKARAVKACREIENNMKSYHKSVFYISKGKANLLSLSYSEGLLKKLGYTVDNFQSWSKSNGIPAIFDGQDMGYKEAVSKRFFGFFECAKLDGETLDLGPEFVMPVYRNEGRQREVGVKYISILDPLPDGIFLTGYTMVKSKKRDLEKENQEGVFEDGSNIGSNECIKKALKKELSI